MGYSANLLFDFADLDDLCKDIEGELDSHSLGAGFSSQGQRIDEFVEHRSALLSYTSDVLYDIDEYLENPLYKGFNNAVDLMAAIDMRDAKTDNTIGLQEHTSMYVGAGMYDEFEGDMTSLNLEDFIGSRNKNNSLTNYQKVDDFADLFAKDYENLVNNDKIDPSEVTLQEYLDSLVLKEFAHKKDAPFWKELLESLSEMTVVIPFIEAATGKTLITGDYLTGDEGAFKVVSGTVSLVTLGYGAAIAKGGGAFAKMFAADILAEAVSGSTVIVCDKAGVPSAVTVALAILLGSTTGVIADKALLKNGIKVTGVDEVDNAIKGGSESFGWDMSEGGRVINGREYSQHAMERMAPDTPSIRAELSRRAEKIATEKGLKVGSEEYYQFCKKYVDPRNIPPSVIEDAISTTKGVAGNTAGTFVHETADVKVIVNSNGKVITVIPK